MRQNGGAGRGSRRPLAAQREGTICVDEGEGAEGEGAYGGGAERAHQNRCACPKGAEQCCPSLSCPSPSPAPLGPLAPQCFAADQLKASCACLLPPASPPSPISGEALCGGVATNSSCCGCALWRLCVLDTVRAFTGRQCTVPPTCVEGVRCVPRACRASVALFNVAVCPVCAVA